MIDVMETETYVVRNMTCGHCVEAVEAEVRAVDGVTSVAADLATKLVRVEGDRFDDGAVRAAIGEAGYRAE
jgi:copper chaperone